MTRSELPRGTYEGAWAFWFVDETSSPTRVFWRTGRMCFPPSDDGGAVAGAAEIGSDHGNGTPMTESFPVLAALTPDGLEIDLQGQPRDLATGSPTGPAEVVNPWSRVRVTLEDGRLVGTTRGRCEVVFRGSTQRHELDVCLRFAGTVSDAEE